MKTKKNPAVPRTRIVTQPVGDPPIMTRCANCDKVHELDDLDEYQDFWSRIQPGDEVPAGDCPDCGAFAYLIKQAPKTKRKKAVRA